MTRKPESGFALLMVFALAAAVAIALYIELPRVAFEAQRTQEQTLIDRGEGYKRAIQLYYRRFRAFPPTMEALDNTNNVRYLRKRYKDPMTGKDEWRIVHGMPNGMLTDSKVQKPMQLGQDPTKAGQKDQTAQPASSLSGGMSTGMGTGSSGDTADQAQSQTRANLRRRPSEGGGDPLAVPGLPGEPQPDPFMQAQQGVSGPAGQAQPVPGQPVPGQPVPGQPGMPQAGQPYPVQGSQGYPVSPGQPYPVAGGQPYPGQGGAPGDPNQQQPQQPGVTPPGQGPYPGQTPYGGGRVPIGYGQQPGAYPQPQAGGPQPGQTPVPGAQPGPGQGSNEAMGMINRILTSPRPGGLQGLQSSGPTMTGGALGIAGVATKYEGAGIKLYNERSKYQEWEFVYDLRKDPYMTGPGGALGGVSGLPGQRGTQPQTQTGPQTGKPPQQ